MNKELKRLLEVSLKIQQWLKSHPKTARIVDWVLQEFDEAIEDAKCRVDALVSPDFCDTCKTCKYWQKYDDYTNAGSCMNEETNKGIDGRDIMFLENFGCRNYSKNSG